MRLLFALTRPCGVKYVLINIRALLCCLFLLFPQHSCASVLFVSSFLSSFPVGAAPVCRRTDSVPLCSWGAQGHTGTKPPAWAGAQGFTPRVSAAGLYSLAHHSDASFFPLSHAPSLPCSSVFFPLLLLSLSVRARCFRLPLSPLLFLFLFPSFARAAPLFRRQVQADGVGAP